MTSSTLWRWLVVLVLGCVLAGTVYAAPNPTQLAAAADPAASPASSSSGLAQMRALQDAFAGIAEKLAPSVVAIQARKKLSALDDYDPQDETMRRYRDRLVPSAGSGVIIDATGYILTNEHVVGGAEELVVVLANRHRYPAKVVSTDPRSDLAVIKVDATDLSPATLGDLATVRQGHWAIAMGNPFGLANNGKPAMTIGIISAIGRALPNFGDDADRHYGNLLQTSADINPGNSGGPLLNLDGQVIGINTAISTRTGVSEGVGFAVSITARTREIISQLKAGKKIEYGFLGVDVAPPTPEESDRAGAPSYLGAIVVSVEANTPAEKAKIKTGDIIVQVDEDTVDDSDHLVAAIGASPIGRPVALTLWRDHKKISVAAVLEKRSDSLVRRNHPVEDTSLSWRGLTLGPITDERRRALGLGRSDAAVEVRAVADKSPAAAAGIKVGDVLEKFDGKSIKRLSELRRAVEATDDGKDVIVQLTGGIAKTVKPGKPANSR